MREINDVKKLSHALSIIAKILRIFTVIGFISAVLSSIILLALPKDFFEMNASSEIEMNFNTDLEKAGIDDLSEIYKGMFPEINIDENGVHISQKDASYTLNNYQLGVLLWTYAIDMAGFYAVMRVVGKFFDGVSESFTPFTESNYENLKLLGIVLLIDRIVPPMMSGILTSIMRVNSASGSFDLVNTAVLVIVYIIGIKLFKYCVDKENPEYITDPEEK